MKAEIRLLEKLAWDPEALRRDSVTMSGEQVTGTNYRAKFVIIALSDARFRREVLKDLADELYKRATALKQAANNNR